jgi:hypothetical protein
MSEEMAKELATETAPVAMLRDVGSLRRKVESELAARIPAAFEFRRRTAISHLSTGMDEIDRLLRGGFARGGLTEICGGACSGRTTLLHSFLAQATIAGELCALVDVNDSFAPSAAVEAGVILDNMLWVRCAGISKAEQPLRKPRYNRARIGTGGDHSARARCRGTGTEGD